MRIACLAWGSRLWKSAPLEPVTPWQGDGPWLPIEFAREADGGELATALMPEASDVRTFWAVVRADDLLVARDQLRRREQIPIERPDGIGSVPRTAGVAGPFDERIAAWAAGRRLDGVVWTALPARSRGIEGRAPSVDEACAYLESLRGETRSHAEDYVRRVPPSLTTPYRAVFEQRFGWTPSSTAAAL